MSMLLRVAVILFSLISLADSSPIQNNFIPSVPASIQNSNSYEADLELAQLYAPVFYFHPDEIYFPQPVDVVLGITRVRQDVHLWLDTTVMNLFTVQSLFTIPSDETYFLDQWFGDTGSSELTNYSTHQAIYESTISPRVGGPEPVIYAHVVRNEDLNISPSSTGSFISTIIGLISTKVIGN
jgi:hypothetical protein